MLRHKPVHPRPPPKGHDLSVLCAGQALVARLRGQGHGDTEATEKEADPLATSVPFGQRDLDGDGDDAGRQTAVERTDEGDRVVVGVDQTHLGENSKILGHVTLVAITGTIILAPYL